MIAGVIFLTAILAIGGALALTFSSRYRPTNVERLGDGYLITIEHWREYGVTRTEPQTKQYYSEYGYVWLHHPDGMRVDVFFESALASELEAWFHRKKFQK